MLLVSSRKQRAVAVRGVEEGEQRDRRRLSDCVVRSEKPLVERQIILVFGFSQPGSHRRPACNRLASCLDLVALLRIREQSSF